MTSCIKKEIRLLLPSFVAALALAGSFWLVPQAARHEPGFHEPLATLGFLLCPVLMVVMALSSFGREISSGTFPELLCQPISRERVWWTKTLLLGLALAGVAAVWRSAFLHYLTGTANEGLKPEALGTLLFVLVAYSGGLWTVLLLRQAGAAFWFTLLVPAALMAMVEGLTRNHPERMEAELAAVLITYALAAFWWARRLFLRAEDHHWTGGTITMPAVGGWRSVLGWRAGRRQFRPRAALLAKEFQLHQSQLLIAGLLAVLHLGVLAARKLGVGPEPTPFLDMVADHFWVLWLVMPVLVGCAAVAEERKLGTLEAQLCLPVKRRTQLVIKFAFALLASILLGVAAPVLLEGRRILPETEVSARARLTEDDLQMPGSEVIQRAWTRVEACRAVLSPVVPFLPMLAGVAALLAIAFYASTLARSTLQALAPAALGIVATGLFLALSLQMDYLVRHPPWRGWLISILGVPVMLLALAGLAYWNFKRVLVGWPVWRRNGLVCLGALALVGTTTAAIYHRVWELAGPLEPPHGPAALVSSQGASLSSDGWNLLARPPDGQIWLGRFWPTFPSMRALLTGDMKMTSLLGAGRYLEGTNWASVVACHLDVMGIKQDGSLWASEKPEQWRQFWRVRSNARAEPIPMVRVGQDTDWRSAVGVSRPIFLLKTNGTLWQWGGGRFDQREGWPGLRALEPKQVGNDSDWAEMSLNQQKLECRKRDGRIWIREYGNRPTRKPGVIPLDDSTALVPLPEGGDDRHWRGRAWFQDSRYGLFQVGLQEDGTLRVGRRYWNPAAERWAREAGVPLGRGTNWLMVAARGSEEGVVTLRSDGTLWQWDFPPDPVANPTAIRATQLGRHSDWVAICSYENGLATLAADGSLWFWRWDPPYHSWSELPIPPLLGASRRPQLIGNVLGRSQ